MRIRKAAWAVVVFLLALCAVNVASAQTYSYHIYVDGDLNPGTGCTVPAIAGADSRLEVDVTGGTAPQVVAVRRAPCQSGSTFGPGTPVGGGYPVGLNNGTSGADVVELADAMASLQLGNSRGLRLAVVAQSASGTDELNATAGGGPIILGLPAMPVPFLSWPLLFVLLGLVAFYGARRAKRTAAWRALSLFFVACGIAIAANFAADGQVGDWSGTPALAGDPAGDATSGESAIDMVNLFGAIENGRVFLRVDVRDLQNNPPVVSTPAVTTLEETPVTLTLTGSDVEGDPITFAIATPPTRGTLGAITPVNATSATVVYTPNANLNGADSFTFTGNDGQGSSAPATAAITVTPVNDPPSFTVGADQAVAENAGAQTVAGWATAISAGPVDESGQTVAFTASVVSATGNLTFATAPAVTANGTLTFAATNGTSGIATVSVVAQDNGGTANGGNDTAAAQTFVINVNAINHAPSFTVGANQTSLEDAGVQTVNAWASAINDGDGNTQIVDFQITGNTNPALFATAPAVSPTGVLTYTAAANANGTASISVVLHDNGGVAFGGIDTSAPQTFTITVTAVNDAPSFTVGPNQSVFENAGPQSVNPWATAISPGPADEAAQTVSFAVTNNTNAALFSTAPAISPTGALTYTPAAGVSGTATITLQVADNGGVANGGADTSAAQNFTITVQGINHVPSFTVGPNQTSLEDAGAQTVNPWATAISDGDGNTQALDFQVTGNSNPSLFATAPAVSPTGVLTYTAAPNANGTATITLLLHDNGGTGNGGVDTSATQNFTITITAVNDAPSFSGGTSASVLESAGLQTFANFHTAISAGPADESGQSLTFNTTVTATTGSLAFSAAPAVAPNGTLTFTAQNGTFGTATVSSTLQDNGGTANSGVDTSAAQTFTITVNNVNDPPVFTVGGTQTVLEDVGAQTAAGFVTGIADGDDGSQTITFSISSNSNPSLFSAGPAIAANGTLTYTPAANANGTATISVIAQDNGGNANGGNDTSAAQSFVINVTAVNDAPSFTGGTAASALESAGPQTFANFHTAISAGPADEAGQTLAFNTSVTATTGSLAFSAAPTVAPNGTLTFTAQNGTFGTATVSSTLQDNGGTANSGVDTSAAQTFTITVTNVNDPPVFTVGGPQTVLEDVGAQTAAGFVTGIADGDDGSQTVTFNITGNNNPTLFSVAPAIAANGTLTYTPAANANGSATITVVGQDNGGTSNGGNDTSAPQNFIINVTAVNDAPSFTGGTAASALESTGPQTFANFHAAISAGPADEASQTLTFNTTVTATTGSLAFSAAPAVAPNGTLTFTAQNGTFGTATVSSTLQDNGGTANGGLDTSAAQTFTITINNVNDPPVFTVGGPQTVLEDAGAQTAAGFLTGIADGDDGSQTITFTVTNNTNPSLFSAGPAIAANGTLTYTPAPNANGVATISVRAQDNGGTANGGNDTSAVQTFDINVTAVNDAPSFTPGADPSVAEDSGPASIAWATAISSGPADESGQSYGFNVATVSGGALFSALPTISVAGQLVFTPAPNASGTATFSVTLQDNGGTANSGADTSTPPVTLTITISPADDAPVAVNDAATVLEDAAATAVNVLANDTDIDGGPISVGAVTQPLNGTVVITGGGTGLTYQPNPNYCNAPPGTTPDSFTYTLAPGGSVGTVLMTVTCVDDAPVAVNDNITITEDDPATAIPVLANDTDVDGGPMSITAITQPANGVVVITGGGSGLTYLPNPNYCNAPTPGTPDTFTYTLTPGGSTATVSVAVTCVVDNPVAVNDAASVNEDAAATPVDVLGNDSNPDGSPIAIGSVTQPANGTVVVIGGGTGLTYQPNPNYCNAPPGSSLDTFTYTIAPGGSVGTVSMTVVCVDDAPVAVADSTTVVEDSGANAINVLANDTDVDGGPKSVASVTQPSNGAVVITGGGTGLTYAPNANYCNNPPGTTLDTFTYTLTPGGSSTTVTVTVTCVNDPPVPPAVANIPVHTHIAIGVADTAPGDLLIPGAIVDPDSSNFVITGAPATTTNGGELNVNASTGAFTYNPPPDFTGNDTFQFTVCDNGVPVACSGPVTVTLVVSGPKIWFVDDDAVVIGTPDGTLQQPLSTLTAAATAAATGERIFVFGGSYTTGITLPAGVELVGHGIDAASTNDFDAELAITPPGHSIPRPLVDQTPPVLTNAGGAGITVTSNNTIRGVHISNSNTAAIGGTGFGTLTVYDDVRVNTNGVALDLTNGTFSVGSVFNGFTSTGGVNNVDLDNVGGSVDLGTGALTGATGTSFSVVNGSTAQIAYAGTVTKTSAGALIDIDTKPSGSITLTGALSASNGTGIRLNNVDAAFTASGVVTLNGGDAAIDVIGGSAGAINFSNTGSAITNPTNEAVVVNGSSPTFTFAGGITKTNNAVSGIRVDGNSSGSVSFPNPTLTLTTQTANAVQLASNGTLTTSFTGGNLTLNTTSGIAFNATGTGNVAVTGTANTATATASMVLQIDGHAITASGVTFRSLNSNGGSNGIRLNNTGTNGGLTVAGTGAAGSGGTIQNATTTGISLATTRSVTLNRMNITGSGDDGINGATVTNFTCDFCVLTNNGNSTADEGMQFTELAGTANITNSAFTNSAHNSVYVQNTGGTLAALAISNNNFVNNNGTNGNHHVLIEGVTGSPVFSDIDVIDNTVANARSIGVQIVGNNTTSMPSVTVTGNTFSNNILAIDASLIQGSNLTFNINNNTINSTVANGSHAINSNHGIPSTGTVRGRIDNVQIGTAGSVGSGSMIGNGVRVVGNDNGTKQYIVTNTTVRETRNGRGIEVVNRNGTGRMDATVTNNNVNTDALPANLPLSGIIVQSNCAATCNALRADVANNSVTVPSGGCAFDLTGVCLAVVETGASTCELLDRAPTGAASANGELIANNPGSTSTSASAGCALTLTPPILPP